MKNIMILMTLLVGVLLFSDGVVIPSEPPVSPYLPLYPIKLLEHNVDIKVEKDVAVVKIDEVFFNDSPSLVKAVYIFPVPDGAVVSDFAMEVNGKTYEAEILSKEEAREEFMKLVAKPMDPALLEYTDIKPYHTFP